ncbi:XRE family transcriptional regulator [Pseudoflavonifractor sp. An176]|nr:helix-turn-helix transcriptional regulator [Pseudoflavonifractor sp. An176]OUP66056.1 XRE family transcriptional regulator [Pseudoflavonifractor sp. An176]
MISYEPLWRTMKQRGATTYTLQVKGGISSSTIRRMKAGDSVSTHTLDMLCKLLDCTLDDIVAYLPDEEGTPFVRKTGKHSRFPW